MKTFNELTQAKPIGYVYVNPTKKSCAQIQNICYDSNINSTYSSGILHCTVAYDSRNIKAVYECDSKAKFKATIIGCKLLGDYLVLLLDSMDLHTLHEKSINAGLHFDYDYYTPHISIKSQADSTDLMMLEQIMDNYIGTTLTLTNESAEKCRV